jgi:hypothetical protein
MSILLEALSSLKLNNKPSRWSKSRVSHAGRCSGGVVFSKLSKLLNQEDALGAPCLQRFRDYSGATKLARCGFRFGLHQLEALLRVDVCSPLARPRGARECREQV